VRKIDILREGREEERLLMLDSFFKRIQKKQSEQNEQDFFPRLVSCLVESIAGRQEGGLSNTVGGADNVHIFCMTVQAAIRTFARTEEEANYLIGQLLLKLISHLVSPLTSALIEQETCQPEKIFNVEPNPVTRPP
jgi:hypothetical protein